MDDAVYYEFLKRFEDISEDIEKLDDKLRFVQFLDNKYKNSIPKSLEAIESIKQKTIVLDQRLSEIIRCFKDLVIECTDSKNYIKKFNIISLTFMIIIVLMMTIIIYKLH